MKKILLLLFLVFIVCLFSGCGEEKTTPLSEEGEEISSKLTQLALAPPYLDTADYSKAPDKVEVLAVRLMMNGFCRRCENIDYNNDVIALGENINEKYVGYLGCGLALAYIDETFDYDAKASAEECAAMILSVMGYEESEFSGKELYVAHSCGFSEESYERFSREDFLKMIWRAVCDGIAKDGETLLSKLVKKNGVSADGVLALSLMDENAFAVDYGTYQNMKWDTVEVKESYISESVFGPTYAVQDLGHMQLDDFPIDNRFDWSPSIMYDSEAGYYKLWWTRGNPHDTIWYAESYDCKNWFNCQRVFRVQDVETDFTLQLGTPDVIKVDGIYYMVIEGDTFESPTVEVFMFTSENGIDWEAYPSTRHPEPIMSCPEKYADSGRYGIGLPSLMYKDGEFWLFYSDAVTHETFKGGQAQCTRLVKSKDPFNFDQNVTSHFIVADRTCTRVRYNTVTNKYYIIFEGNPFGFGFENENALWMIESVDDTLTFPTNSIAQIHSKGNKITTGGPEVLREYANLVTNEWGQIDTKTMYAISLLGVTAEAGKDWKDTCNQWELGIIAFNPTEFLYDPILLPDGNAANAITLKKYEDLDAEWVEPVVQIPKGTPILDAELDEAYTGCEPLDIRWVYMGIGTSQRYDLCRDTDTRGTAYLMWDEEYLYGYVKVDDVLLSINTKTAYGKDGITIYVKTGDSAVECTMAADGTANKKATVSISQSGDSYIIEFSYPWTAKQAAAVSEGEDVFFDIRINDDNRGNGIWESLVFWSNLSDQFNFTGGHLGRLVLEA